MSQNAQDMVYISKVEMEWNELQYHNERMVEYRAECERQIAEAVAAEREACAKIALCEIREHDFGRYDYENSVCSGIAASIRARGAKP